MSKAREEERAAKKRKRNAKSRGKSDETMYRDQLIKAGFDARFEPRRSFGERATDVLYDYGEIHGLIESKKRADWHVRKEIFQWLEQAESDSERFAERRWPMLCHCDSPGKGVKREPLCILRWSVMLEMLEAYRDAASELEVIKGE